ncbi:MAG: glycine--tRNA ligase [Cyanobacteria bacterium NC_groundwater_1444_Ag_S-0.65um_54_12]|nr:glycine--tRNA ligase [Cyanobacteria bacterium NC_groundwater_1444_Ag_S-0.65um_54_12]
MERVVSLCKRRGIILQSSEIYGGLASCWDYGPYGVLLKNNVKRAWWRTVVQAREDMVGLDAAILMRPEVWHASGHIETFHDPLVDCKSCKQRFRADQLISANCPVCGGELTEPRNFNLMFKTFMGPVEDSAALVYLRPETAQGIFVNFRNVMTATRRKPPFGIAQIGKAFRNEITPGNFTFRTREFEQMEIEYFCPPEEADAIWERWVEERFRWYRDLGIRSEQLRKRQQSATELAHYARATVDIEYRFPFGWSELEGIANRTDYDLAQHSRHSGQDLSYFDEETKQHYLPYVVEPSAGADRATLAFLVDAFAEQSDDKGEIRTVLQLHHQLAPIKVAILPLSKKPELTEPARRIAEALRAWWTVEFDVTGSIGKRYRRQDEIGTPYCLTLDFASLDDHAVTIRDRDSMCQERVPVVDVIPYLQEKLATKITNLQSDTIFSK